MPASAQLRLTWLEVVLLLAVTLIAWMAWGSFSVVRGIRDVPATFATMEREYTAIGEQVPPVLDTMQDRLLRFALNGTQADWDQFGQHSLALHRWINTRKQTGTRSKIVMMWPVVVTGDVGTLMEVMNGRLRAYDQAAQQVRLATTRDARLAQFVIADRMARQLRDVTTTARAQAESIRLFRTGSRHWFPLLRQLLLATLLALCAFAIWLSYVIYRRMISPLRQRLAESQRVIDGQQKFIHFGRLATSVAHEIRNPLTAVRARLYTMQKALPSPSPAQHDAVVIQGEIQRLDRIVTDFLHLARPAPPRLEPLSVKEFLLEVTALLAPQYEEHSITLECEVGEDLTIEADAGQLKQVVINLIRNAAESIGHDGHITLRARAGERGMNGSTAAVALIEVEDTGPGMTPEVQQRLFDPFFSTKEGGTGLGLSIAAQLMDKHGGRLECQSEEGHGATFTIILPIREASA